MKEEESGEHRNTLVVLLRGMSGNPTRLDDLEAATREGFPGSHLFRAELAMGWLSNSDPNEIVRGVVRQIDDELEGREFENIVLVGYSAGGLLARAVLIEAWEEHPEWAEKVGRLVLLAGMNRGWSFAPTVNPFWSLCQRILYMGLRALGRSGFLASLRRGAPFVISLRLRWLRLPDEHPEAKQTLVVQLLGTVDDIVSPDDNVDIETGSDFVYLEVPRSSHEDVLCFADEDGPMRKEIYLRALYWSRPELEKVDRSLGRKLRPDTSVTDALFVVHGIRDYGHWTSHLARFVAAEAEAIDRCMRTLTPSYGYFGMAPFLLPAKRAEKVRWLADRYVEARAEFPNARFHFIGHSNGTYLLARALQDHDLMEFESVVFAGSVVRSGYDWERLVGCRVGRVLNFAATSDWVVAIFPRFLERLPVVRRWLDLGGAGHDGFFSKNDASKQDIEYVEGSHSAALQYDYWKQIAEFILRGPKRLERGEATGVVDDHKPLGRLAARFAPLVWAALLAIVTLPGLAWVSTRLRPQLLQNLGLAEWDGSDWTLAGLLWFLLMRAILTRA